jgi:hypothetical protein
MPVNGLSGAKQLAVGWGASCALRGDSTVMCWGPGYNGSIGDGQYQTRSMAVQLPALAGVMQVASGGNHSCALLGDGTVWCWGMDTDGQLGDGILQQRHPVGVRMPCPE